MYVITCPSCGNVKKVSFARAGAVVHCDKCDKPIRLDRSNTRRVTPPPKPDQGAEAAKLLAERQNEHATRQAGEQAREVVGLSGLSELMAQTSGAAGKTSSGSGGSSGGTSGGDPNDLAALAELPVRFLSAGQKRRLALARLVALDASVWLLDEPSVALDATSLDALRELIAEHKGHGGAVVASTHADLGLADALTLDVSQFSPNRQQET